MPGFRFGPLDERREEAREIMRQRPHAKFFLLPKRPQRTARYLPENQGEGRGNGTLHVPRENPVRENERFPILKERPSITRGLMRAPLSGAVGAEAIPTQKPMSIPKRDTVPNRFLQIAAQFIADTSCPQSSSPWRRT